LAAIIIDHLSSFIVKIIKQTFLQIAIEIFRLKDISMIK